MRKDAQQIEGNLMRRIGRVVLLSLLVLNALDLTTSIHVYPEYYNNTPWQRSTAGLAVQLALAAGLAAWLIPQLPAAWRAVRDAPVPLAAKWVCGIVMAVQCLHVGFKEEHFPFSYVGMYSLAAERSDQPLLLQQTRIHAVETEDGLELYPMVREGDLWFAQYISMDGRDMWPFYRVQDHPVLNRFLMERWAEADAPPLRMADISIDGAGEITITQVYAVEPDGSLTPLPHAEHADE